MLVLSACTDTSPPLAEAGSTTMLSGESSGSETGTETETGAPPSDMGAPEPGCGDGVVSADELCDDGNTDDADGCSNSCIPRLCTITWSLIADEVTASNSLDYEDLESAFSELPNGDIVLAQVDDSGGDADLRLSVYTPAGALVSETIVAFSPARDRVYDVLADPSGDIFVAGAANVVVDAVATVVRISGVDGSELWRFEADGELALSHSYDWASALEFDDQGRVLVATMVTRSFGGRMIEVHALDAQTGSSEWMGSWLGGADDYDFATDLAFDPVRARVVVVVADNRGPQWWEPVLLGFEAPSEDPVLETSPLGDEVNSMPEFDVPLAVTIGGNGRMWMSSQELENDLVHTLVSEIDPADGSLLGAHDLRELGLGHGENNGGYRSLHAGPEGGLVWVGSNDQNHLLALDEDAQLDCVINLGGGFGITTAFTGSDGGLYAGGFVVGQGGRYTALARVY